jgi:hypothetical protein
MADPKVPTPTTSATSKGLADTLSSLGINIDLSKIPTGSAAKAKKSGTYTRTQISSTIPKDQALVQTINQVYKNYYGRDARQDEISSLLPALKEKYTGKDGKSKTTVKETYQNGNLIKTEYLTADNLDPKVWLDEQVKQKVAAGQIAVNTAGIPEGLSGKYFVAIKNLARNNGINLSDAATADYANKINAGTISEDTVLNTIRESAASAFPQFADKIKAGIDLKTLADPYIQSMSRILEIPDSGIDVFDPTVRSALSFTMPDGKVGTKSLYDFEKDLRKDSRWQYTNNAREDVSNSVTKVLKDFGFMG